MTETQDPLYSSYIVNCVFNAFTSYTAVTLNILTMHAISKTSSLPKPLKTLLLSLAVSDLCVGLLAQPLYITFMVKQLQQTSVSNSTITAFINSFITSLLAYTSFFNVVAISVDRFLAIHLHLRYQELVTFKRVVAAVISIWVFSAFLASINASFTPTNPLSVFVVFAIIVGLCIICTTIVYGKIYFTVRRHINDIHVLQLQQVEMANATRVRKTAVSTFYIYLVFWACCLPEYCRLIMSILHNPPSTSMLRFALYSWTLLYLNSSLNPVIYCWRLRDIRHAIMDTLRNIFGSQEQAFVHTVNSRLTDTRYDGQNSDSHL